jgi:hypothetical protein
MVDLIHREKQPALNIMKTSEINSNPTVIVFRSEKTGQGVYLTWNEQGEVCSTSKLSEASVYSDMETSTEECEWLMSERGIDAFSCLLYNIS